ncbi:MAG TPA: MlaD family protein [Spirochaetota bacterium]|jgi:phospholipid/cholesterol/gamma-HCH transport system substrate-binding protein|nr:MCE family protein [Spirochaetota bacterium]OQA97118.1 MAG: mce related protein [Spirochaetes bacterium ADurb.Bin218]HOK01882.1 MlaD family protein [Spirochaetota bacterium]HOK92321.1 MlaD family protein [Spirochaetota bacterium]HON17041.1 MlaD family protein [Spirochaetota bacterium]
MKRINEFMVGIVFVAAMTVLAYFTIVRGEFFSKKEYYEMSVIFSDVESLAVGNKVLVNGVEAGTVESIELMPDAKVLVIMKMFKKFTLYENYKILLKNQTAIGGRIIVIYPGEAAIENIAYETVDTVKNLHGSTIGDPISKISEVIDENREDLRIAIRNFREFSEKINKGEGTIAKLVNEGTIHDDTGKLIQELRDTIEDSREQAPVTSFIRAALTAF